MSDDHVHPREYGGRWNITGSSVVLILVLFLASAASLLLVPTRPLATASYTGSLSGMLGMRLVFLRVANTSPCMMINGFTGFVEELNSLMGGGNTTILAENYTVFKNRMGMTVAGLNTTLQGNHTLDVATVSGGIGLFRLDGGWSHVFRPLNTSLAWALRNITIGVMGGDIGVSVSYEGIHAGKMIMAWNASEISEIASEYGGDVCVVNGSDHYIVYVHPYEKYRVVINGTRIHYPVIVRGLRDGINGFIIQYLLIASPTVFGAKPQITETTMDERLINEIVEDYDSIPEYFGQPDYNYTADDIMVKDIYYGITAFNESFYYTPWIVIAAQAAEYEWLETLPNGTPLPITAATLLGPYHPTDGSLNLTLILTPYNETSSEESNETGENNTEAGETGGETSSGAGGMPGNNGGADNTTTTPSESIGGGNSTASPLKGTVNNGGKPESTAPVINTPGSRTETPITGTQLYNTTNRSASHPEQRKPIVNSGGYMGWTAAAIVAIILGLAYMLYHHRG